MEQLKIKLLNEIEVYKNPDNKQAQQAMESAERYLYNVSLPDIYNPKDPNAVTNTREGTFEGVCMSLSQKGVHNPEDLTVYQFYKRVEIIYEQSKPKNNNGRDNRR